MSESGQGAITPGLAGVMVCETRLSAVDGARGALVLAGQAVEDVAGRLTFEEVAGLLWRAVPEVAVPEDVRAALAEARAETWAWMAADGGWRWRSLDRGDAMDALRSAAALLPDPGERWWLPTGAMAVLLGAWLRGRAGLGPVAPSLGLSHAADLLRMASPVAAEPDPALAAALDAYLATVIDHGLNASTFAARVVTSTRSDLVSAVVAAIGALKGPLHGGAPGPVLDMLDAVGDPSRARAWVEAELARGERIMGMGHRVYRVRDPRAAVLERALRALGSAGGGGVRLALARAVEEAAEAALAARKPDRALRANVEFYTAVLLEAVGLPREAFAATFAVGRVAGWTAHVLEERRFGRLIRPTSRYIGPMPATVAGAR